MNLLNELPEVGSLTTEQEAALAKRGTAASRNQLVLASMREAFLYAKRCCRGRLSDDELFSVCYAALQAAAKNFKPPKGPFFSYCKVYIRGHISREWSSKDVVKNASRHEGPEPTKPDPRHGPDVFERGEVAEHDDPLWHGGTVDPDFESIDTHERWKLIQPVLVELSERERMVIELTYRAGFGLQKVGSMLSFSRQAAAQTLHRAMTKIRKKLLVRRMTKI